MTEQPLHQLLLRSQSAMHREVLTQAAKLGLSPGQPKVLEFLLNAGESNQKTIAAHCEIEPATVGSILTRMERDGLIARTQHDGNRRSLYVSLTEKGQAAAEEMDKVFRQADAKASAALTPEQLRQLCELLKTVCGSLSGEGEK